MHTHVIGMVAGAAAGRVSVRIQRHQQPGAKRVERRAKKGMQVLEEKTTQLALSMFEG